MVAIIDHIDQNIRNVQANIQNCTQIICNEPKHLKDFIQSRDDLVHYYCNQQARSGLPYLYKITCGVSDVMITFYNIG